MKSRPSSLMIGSLTLGLIAGGFGAFLGLKRFAVIRQEVPLRVVFEGSASGLHKGGSVNFGGIRVGEVVSLRLDKTHRVVALTRIDKNAPIRKDTLAGLEFQGLTGVAAISLTGGSIEAEPVPLDKDGIPVLLADPDALLDTQAKIRVALRNVDKVIADNQDALKDTLLSFETFTASLANSTERIDSVVRSADNGVAAVDSALTKTQGFLDSLASNKNGELLPTVMSYRELIESFNKRSGALMSEGRKMLGDVSQSINKGRR
jgi:phospholipid/cholesterol/gamma-HCH transport system substrate-binding protein